MKPTKNRVFCHDCGKLKILFDKQEKADAFIRFNKEEIEEENGCAPCRSYFCQSCSGWHTTHHKISLQIESRTERVVKAYKQQVSPANFEEAESILLKVKKALNSEDYETCESFLNQAKRVIYLFSIAQSNDNRGKEIIYRHESYLLKMRRKIERTVVHPINRRRKELLKEAERFLEKGLYDECKTAVCEAYALYSKIDPQYYTEESTKKIKNIETKLNIRKGIDVLESMEHPDTKELFFEIDRQFYSANTYYDYGSYSQCVCILQYIYRLLLLINPDENNEEKRNDIENKLANWIDNVQSKLIFEL